MTYQANGPAVAAPTTTLRRCLAAAFLVATGGLFASACADNESSLFIRDCIPPIFQQQSGCIVPEPQDANVFLAKGLHDVAFQGSYTCALRVGNQVVPQGSSDQIRTETSRITLYAADVRLTDLAGNAITYGDGSAVEFSVPVAGFVDPGSSSDGDAGYGYAVTQLIDGEASEALAQRSLASGTADVLAGVIVYGRTLGGQELETPEWFFQISVCVGCTCVQTNDSCIPGASSSSTQTVACTSDLGSVDCTQFTRFIGATCGEVQTNAASYYSSL